MNCCLSASPRFLTSTSLCLNRCRPSSASTASFSTLFRSCSYIGSFSIAAHRNASSSSSTVEGLPEVNGDRNGDNLSTEGDRPCRKGDCIGDRNGDTMSMLLYIFSLKLSISLSLSLLERGGDQWRGERRKGTTQEMLRCHSWLYIRCYDCQVSTSKTVFFYFFFLMRLEASDKFMDTSWCLF